jgi:NAD(P)-dependent dehydrogenase (short-subunit alcohol dehydrogenase family)
VNDEALSVKSLLGRVAIVTGSGQGIGRGVAMSIAGAGAHVVIVDQAPQRITAVAAEIEALGVQALGVPTDCHGPTRSSGWFNRRSSVSGKSTFW